jgi:hypothetical protein
MKYTGARPSPLTTMTPYLVAPVVFGTATTVSMPLPDPFKGDTASHCGVRLDAVHETFEATPAVVRLPEGGADHSVGDTLSLGASAVCKTESV